MTPEKPAYEYEFIFVQDEAGRPFICRCYAFSFMSAYSQAVAKLKKAKKTKARSYKLETMHRFY
jgi:hypothetical protein